MSWSEIWLCAVATVEPSAVCTSTICEEVGTASCGPGRGGEVRAADATVISSFALGANPDPIPPETPPARPLLRMAKDFAITLPTDREFWVLACNSFRTAVCLPPVCASVCGTFCGTTARRSNDPGKG